MLGSHKSHDATDGPCSLAGLTEEYHREQSLGRRYALEGTRKQNSPVLESRCQPFEIVDRDCC